VTATPELTDVRAIAEQVWSSSLGEAEPLMPQPLVEGAFPAEQAWSAAVTVSGGWDASVTVEVADRVAQALATTMLGTADVEDADIADAVGELVNMIGGNVKSLMPGPSTLSLPAVAAGRAVHPSGAVEGARYDALWSGEPVRVSVHVLQNA
jgi:chemotaxis protein CheX